MAKNTKAKVRNVIPIGDLHGGCRLAPCPRDGIGLDDGGRYMPSRMQLKLIDLWDYFTKKWIPESTEGEPYDVVFMGDMLDGVHHKSTTQISHNIEDQKSVVIALLRPVIDDCRASGGKVFWLRGTEAHAGDSGKDEEALARELGAVPNENGQYARWELWKDVDGSLVHFAHHVGTTGSMAYESTAVTKELTESYIEAARWGQRPPDLVCRAHRHRYFKVEFATAHGRATGVVGPGWQSKTPFAYKIAGARVSSPQFGGYAIRKVNGILYTLEKVWNVERSKVED